MKIIVVGLSHHTAPVTLREKVSETFDEQDQALHQLIALESLKESLLVSTCNRLELYAVCSEPETGIQAIQTWLAQRHGLDPVELTPHLYAHQDAKAIRHGFRVAASLDSLVVGEAQILGQMKQAFQEATEAGTAGRILQKFFQHQFQVAKKVRTQTGIARHPVSIASVAVNLARRIFGQLRGHTCLLIGAGEMVELAAQHLVSQGVSILVVNRTLDRAIHLANRYQGEGFDLTQLPAQLQRADIILSSTGASGLIVQADAVKSALKKRRQRPQFYIDIAVPRDLDPAIGQIENAFLYDIDDLKQIVDDNKDGRSREIDGAEQIVQEEAAAFLRWQESLSVVPTVVALREKMERLRDAELARLQREWPDLKEEEKKKLEAFSRLLVNKMLHPPLTRLRQMASEPDSELYVDTTRKLFELDRK